jgi:hypothetical protein
LKTTKPLFAIFFTLSIFALPARAVEIQPWAVLYVHRDETTRELGMKLVVKTPGKEDQTREWTVNGGVDKWEDFGKWYEDLFGIAYMSNDFKSLWKRLRKKAAGMSPEFIPEDVVKELAPCGLLVVVDDEKPFIADALRYGNKWLFEIVPIVHIPAPYDATAPPDLTDTYQYRKYLVVDCQGPNDREGAEAPGVAAHLDTLAPGGVTYSLLTALTPDDARAALQNNTADILHLATHAHPDEFFPGRIKPGIKADEIENMRLNYRTVLSTGCHTGNPMFARAILDADTRFFIASMYTTSGKDGVRFASDFYGLLLAGKSPFEAFYEIKNKNITASGADYPDILRFVFFVNP